MLREVKIEIQEVWLRGGRDSDPGGMGSGEVEIVQEVCGLGRSRKRSRRYVLREIKIEIQEVCAPGKSR